MARLQLTPAPTFQGKVSIPVAGAEPAQVVFTFKHRTRAELSPWVQDVATRDDVDTILQCATAWDLPEPFTREKVAELVQNYIGAPALIFDFYVQELTRAKLGN
jgi:hypothetical protein